MGAASGTDRWNEIAAIALTVALVAVTFPLSASGGGTDGDAAIGEYVQLGFVRELTEEHIEPTDGGLVVDAPSGTDEIRIERAYLRDRLGAWGADHAFALTSGRIVAEAETVTFTTFEPNGTPTYTLGAHESIRFLERPMWLSVATREDRWVNVTADAADTTGQAVRVDAEWLRAREISAPAAVHADGTSIPVARVADGSAYRVDVPHFSGFSLCDGWWTQSSTSTSTSGPGDCLVQDVSPEIDAKVRVNGVVSDHQGEKVWYPETQTLEVEVTDYPTEVDVLVERAWVDDHITHLAVWQRNVTEETLDGTAYYVSSFPAADTPTSHVLREYQAANHPMFTSGNLSTIWSPVWGFINASSSDGSLSLQVRPPAGSNVSLYPLFINHTFLSERNVTSPIPFNGSGGRIEVGATLNETFFLVEATASDPARATISNGSSTTVSQEGECDAAMTHLPMGSDPPTWWHDDNNAYSYASVYVGEGMFCWDWHLNAAEISWDDLSHFQVWGYAEDPSTGDILCEILVPAGDPSKMRDSAKDCEPDDTIPDRVVVYFEAHAMRKDSDGAQEDSSGSTAPGRVMWKGTGDCSIIPVLTGIWDAVGQLAYQTFCVSPAKPWLDEQLTNLWTDWLESEEQDEDGNPEMKVWHERLITNTSMEVGLPEAEIYVDVVDTNSYRNDTWDFLEEAEDNEDTPFDTPPLLEDRSGGQRIYWRIEDVEEAKLDYDADYSHIDEISSDTDSNQNYRTTNWNPGQTYLEAKAWDDVTDFDSNLDLKIVEWEAPEPLPKEAKIGDGGSGCESDHSASETVTILDTHAEANRTEPWMDVEVVDFSGLDAENVSDFGNVSLQDIDHWNSTAKAVANATVDNETFVKDACGLDETISYDYGSPMTASSSGSSTIRDTSLSASDEEVYTIRWYYIPPPS